MTAALLPLEGPLVSLVHFKVEAARVVLPDTYVDFACVDGRIDVIGPMTVARAGRYQVGSHVQLLSLHPLLASSWLNIPLLGLSDQVVTMREICPSAANALRSLFAAELGPDDFLGACSATSTDDARAGRAASLLARGCTVSQTAAQVDLGDRQFSRWFHSKMGMSPKRYQRVLRLRRALLTAKRGLSLAAVAADAGYADQAHFTREVTALTGSTPRTILPNVGNVQDIGEPIG